MLLRAAIVVTMLTAASAEADPQTTHFVCDVGPIQKHIGASDWSVFSCGDGTTLLFNGDGIYFQISVLEDGIERGGESAGGKDKIDPAFIALKGMSRKALAALIEETKSAASR